MIPTMMKDLKKSLRLSKNIDTNALMEGPKKHTNQLGLKK